MGIYAVWTAGLGDMAIGDRLLPWYGWISCDGLTFRGEQAVPAWNLYAFWNSPGVEYRGWSRASLPIVTERFDELYDTAAAGDGSDITWCRTFLIFI